MVSRVWSLYQCEMLVKLQSISDSVSANHESPAVLDLSNHTLLCVWHVERERAKVIEV